MIGNKFGKLTVLALVPKRTKYRLKAYLVRCECGMHTYVSGGCLTSGHTVSCGCYRPLKEKACKRHELWGTYQGMKTRCLNPNHESYHRYGGRGIAICQRWLDSFWNFVDDVGERPEGLTLDRIDNDAGYCKDNCKWSTMKEQSNNRIQVAKRMRRKNIAP